MLARGDDSKTASVCMRGCARSPLSRHAPACRGQPVRRGFSIDHGRLWDTGSSGHRRAEATPSFGRLCRTMTVAGAEREPQRTPSVNDANPFRRYRVMRPLAAFFAVTALALASTSSPDATGCLKGAVVGGVAGHYAGHHGVLGALAGCAYGRHRAKEQARQPKGQAPAGQERI